MTQTITQLFNDLAVAPQPVTSNPGTFNGMIKAAPKVQNVSGPLSMASPASMRNFLMGEEPGGSLNPKISLNPNMSFLPNYIPLAPEVPMGTPAPNNISQVFGQMPETKLNAGNISLANPTRNTASTRIIA